ncbi:NAD(P)-dependent dehydrogenase (short-subunit alcohol dehydrogenase family) [Novosphingobium chloroacetimidivorans]|uniref:NAD(P)-dependent dehydrogenase (Short-subunit alcohol dehydrogenase family) n=1 Tax=Novosphingobium chloroacetimidivorans TaxID=1428314 RepID=A0A7W7K6Q0_9SPHN|nr:SDR family oxidoreductase [Novosphingobium chloroacetimidivorans]MBB4856920.1 NAD(P)-dependent dehydrogenase (short-subunit alcohol dehydrogenase family) [Novosphingobium chloroacetimidivorans]
MSIVERPAVLITGGARRIGAAIATAFGAAGWHVVIHYGTSRAEAEALAATLDSAEIVGADLRDLTAATSMIAHLATRLADWRVLVNCASVFELDDVDALQPTVFGHAMQVNAATPALLAQAFLRDARARAGRRVIAVTDQKIENPNPDFFSYTMSKHALAATIPMLSMARTDSRDRIYGLAPGAILASHDQHESEIERSHRMNLLERKTGADEIAQAALFLSEGWLASGETLFIDSGQHLLAQPRDVLFLAREAEAASGASAA